MNDDVNGDVIRLGVNIDHIATLRQARGTQYPSPADAVVIAEHAGADSITVHLREDRRHIQDHDLGEIKAVMSTHMNLECAVTAEMLDIAVHTAPADCCLVPEKRAELTTEGGLDVVAGKERIRDACRQLREHGIRVSLFIDPDEAQLDAAADVGAPVIELHTGSFADEDRNRPQELARIARAAEYGHALGLVINAGHGLHYRNVAAVAAIPQIVELNIGHAIISRAVLDGLSTAVREMKRLMIEARQR